MFASHRFTKFAGTALIAGALGLAAVVTSVNVYCPKYTGYLE
jgi:hypothetical protein